MDPDGHHHHHRHTTYSNGKDAIGFDSARINTFLERPSGLARRRAGPFQEEHEKMPQHFFALFSVPPAGGGGAGGGGGEPAGKGG